MFFFDLLLALYLQLALATGEETALGLVALGSLALIGGGWWLTNYIVESLVNSKPDETPVRRSPRVRFAEMSDESLNHSLQRDPSDPFALREQIRRQRSSISAAELASRIESLLAMKPKFETDDLAMLYHQLADLYCGPLGKKLGATQLLASFADAHPNSKEAQFMRDRIKHIGTSQAD